MSNDFLFSESVCNSLGNYVYRLIDPRNGETFYVGKGIGNRVFAHIKGELKYENDQDKSSEKMDRIRTIKNEGLEITHVIHRHNIPTEAVFEVEAALIDAYPGLANEQGGHHSTERGPMNAYQVVRKYDLPTLDENPKDKLVLININSIDDKSSVSKILHQVQYAWKIDAERASRAEYVLAVQRGVIIGAFQNCRWHPANNEFFPNREEVEGRYGFHAEPAEKSKWDYYVGEHGKRISNEKMRHVQFPIRYWNI
jgi:hypothetical protein